MRRDVFMALVASMVAVLASVTACSPAQNGGSAPAITATTPAATTAPTPTPTPFRGDLRTLLLTVPPSSVKTVSPSGSPNGTFGADQVAAAFSDPVEGRRQVQAANFLQGAQVEWVESDRTWIGVLLYEFGDPGKARDWSRGMQNGFHSDPFGSCVMIDGIQDGCVFSRTSMSANGRWLSEAVFARSDFTVEIFSTGPKQIGTRRLMNYALAQFALLPSD